MIKVNQFVMSGFNFGDLAQALSETKLYGVNFVGQAKNWGTIAEGMFTSLQRISNIEFFCV